MMKKWEARNHWFGSIKLIDIVMPTNHADGLAIRWPLIVDFSMYPLVI